MHNLLGWFEEAIKITPESKYVDSNGAKGVKPPAFVDEMISDINEFQSTSIGSPRFNELGERLVLSLIHI